MGVIQATKQVEKWGTFEVSVNGRCDGNPFTDYDIQGEFIGKNERKTVDGFYDGDGVWRVRFMPSFEGQYTYRVYGSFTDEAVSGSFDVTAPSKDNHGPVRVANTYHFAYEDGTPYYSVGTTCYAWVFQKEELQEQTLETLKDSAFNKLRFCIFPKHYLFNFHEPVSYPYEGTPVDPSRYNEDNFFFSMGSREGNDFDYKRLNPSHFARLERRIQDLMRLGIEADLIVMHPYDRWGFSCMSREEDDLYWKYVVARFSAYRNVWWSLANEYDLMKHKTLEDWEHYAAILCEKDAYMHLRSIHNCQKLYDYSRPWVTHCSYQRTDLYLSGENVTALRERYRKPVVLDEIVYEGNINMNWGNIPGEEMVRRCWEGAVRGGYPGHGETYVDENDILWWSHGGRLKGSSPARLKFLRRIMEETPGYGLREEEQLLGDLAGTPDTFPPAPYHLYYYGYRCPSYADYFLPEDGRDYEVEIIDTWEMTITSAGTYPGGKLRIQLPGKSFIAVRIYEKGLLR